MSLEGERGAEIADKLRRMSGAGVISTSQTDHVVTVQDPEKWNEKILQLKELFWPLLREAYATDDSEMERQLKITFENASRIYLKSHGNRVAGFCSMQQSEVDASVGILRDIVVDKAERGQGVGGELYSSVFSDSDYNAIVGVSVTLAAIHNRLKVAQKHGYTTYWGNMGDGDPEVERLRGINTEYMKAEDMFAEKSLPAGNEGLVVLKGEIFPPLQESEVEKLPPDNMLLSTARRILELQRTFGEPINPSDPVVAGHLISVRIPHRPETS